MEVLNPNCAGLDVHKKSVTATARTESLRKPQTKEFPTTTKGIETLGKWLQGVGVTTVVMESTGVYWKPIWNILEGSIELVLCNARSVKALPGRKTDVSDSQWLCQLHRHGLIPESFVPSRPQRELRDLTRQRAQLAEEKTRVANRIHKVLEDANIKLSSVASDVLGVSGRAMIRAIIDGQQNSKQLAELARKRLREKLPQLREALHGHVTDHHRFMLRMLFDDLERVEGVIEEYSKRIQDVIASGNLDEEGDLPFDEAVDLLTGVIGINRVSAENILAEIGTDMSRFRTDRHLAAWAGSCPGNDESAGIRRSGRRRKGNRWLRRALSQAATGAARGKHSYLRARYYRLASRRGKKVALVAISNTLLRIVHHMLKYRRPFSDLGFEYYDQRNLERLTGQLVRRLERLGHKVTLESPADSQPDAA